MTTTKQLTGETTLQWVLRQLREHDITPPTHSQDTMTGLRGAPYADYVVDWHEWRYPDDGGDYNDSLAQIYKALGIVEGNGEWYISAYHYDHSLSRKTITAWDTLVCEILSRVEPSDFWVWIDEE